MNTTELYRHITTAKQPPNENQQSEDARANEVIKENWAEERARWLANPYTQMLLKVLQSKHEDLIMSAKNSVSNPEVAVRKLNQAITLNEIENYVRTGKI